MLINLGLAGNFMDQDTAEELNITQPLSQLLCIHAIDEAPIRDRHMKLHMEPLLFQVSAFHQSMMSLLSVYNIWGSFMAS